MGEFASRAFEELSYPLDVWELMNPAILRRRSELRLDAHLELIEEDPELTREEKDMMSERLFDDWRLRHPYR